MTTQSSPVTSKPLACVSSFWARCLLTLLLAAFGTVVFPANSRADMSFLLDSCNTSDGCNQTINFTPATSGTTIFDDPNPPNPFYSVSATSDGILAIHGSGSSIDAVNGLGFVTLTLTLLPNPDGTQYAWTAFEFMLDSIDKTQPLNSTGLVLTVKDEKGNLISSPSLAFPHEGNSGENQHYLVRATNGEAFTQLILNYTDPFPLTGDPNHLINTIQDIHNMDVHSVLVPEPSSFLLVGLSLLAIRPFLRRYL